MAVNVHTVLDLIEKDGGEITKAAAERVMIEQFADETFSSCQFDNMTRSEALDFMDNAGKFGNPDAQGCGCGKHA